MNELERLKAQLATALGQWEELSAALEPKVAGLDAGLLTIKARLDAFESKGVGEELEKLVSQLVDVQGQVETLRSAIAEMEAGSQSGEDSGEPEESAGEKFIGSDLFREFQRELPHKVRVTRGRVLVDAKSLNRRRRVGQVKTFGNDALLVSTNAGNMAEFFRAEITEAPKRRGLLMRDLMTNIMVPDGHSTVRTKRESAEYELIAKLTELISADATPATQRTIKVDRIAGWTTAAPYNTITLDNGTDPAETFEIATITPDDAEEDPNGPATILTVATNEIKAYPLGQLCTSDTFAPTLEARLKPKALDVWEDVNVPLEKIAQWVETSKEEMEDDVRARDTIDRRLMSRYGREEDKHILYGPGGSSDILGFFNDTDIPSFLWSASAAGQSKLDFVVDLIFELANSDSEASHVLMSPLDFRDIVKLKGDDKHYVFWKIQTESAPLRIHMAQVITTTSVNQGDVLVGDFPGSSTLWLRKEAEIFVGQPGNFFLENKMAVLIEGRVGASHDRPLSFAIGQFDSAP